MVVVLGVAGVLALLGVRPATHLLQAARGVPALDQAQGLWVGRGRQHTGSQRQPPHTAAGLPSHQQRVKGDQGLSQGCGTRLTLAMWRRGVVQPLRASPALHTLQLLFPALPLHGPPLRYFTCPAGPEGGAKKPPQGQK